MKPWYIVLLSCFALASCSSMNTLTLSVTEPSPITLPQHVSSAAIVNRTAPDSSIAFLHKVDQILSAELKGIQEEGSSEVLRGLNQQLQANQRFSNTVIVPVAYKTTRVNDFSPLLSWDEIEKICQTHSVDILFVLEVYDTDTKLSYKTVPVTVRVPIIGEVTTLEHEATASTNVRTGWRIYYPEQRIIVDQYLSHDNVTSSGRGINPMVAAAAIVGQKKAITSMSFDLGVAYGKQLLPYTHRVSRSYYVRGTNNFKIAKRRARAGNWDGAAELWFIEVSHSKRKIAGRAHYNMAIIHEINGNLTEAIEWAEKSYTDFNNKKALRYLRILQQRKSQHDLLQRQLSDME